MIHAFMLVIFMGASEARKQEPNPMYFRSIYRCLYYAKRVTKQYSNYIIPVEDRVVAYCKVVKVDPKGTLVYDH